MIDFEQLHRIEARQEITLLLRALLVLAWCLCCWCRWPVVLLLTAGHFVLFYSERRFSAASLLL